MENYFCICGKIITIKKSWKRIWELSLDCPPPKKGRIPFIFDIELGMATAKKVKATFKDGDFVRVVGRICGHSFEATSVKEAASGEEKGDE